MAESKAPSRGKSAMGGDKKSSSKSKSSKSKSKKPHSIHVRRGKSGGFIAEHHFKSESPDEMTPESEEHVVPDIDALKEHMAEHMGDQPGQEPAEAEPAPTPSAAPTAAHAPMAAQAPPQQPGM
jgi:hypothetical protein